MFSTALRIDDLNIIKHDVLNSELGKKGQFGHKQSFPNWWIESIGWKRSEIINIVNKIEAKKKLTKLQKALAKQVAEEFVKTTENLRDQFLRTELEKIDPEELTQLSTKENLPILLAIINEENPGSVFTKKELLNSI